MSNPKKLIQMALDLNLGAITQPIDADDLAAHVRSASGEYTALFDLGDATGDAVTMLGQMHREAHNRIDALGDKYNLSRLQRSGLMILAGFGAVSDEVDSMRHTYNPAYRVAYMHALLRMLCCATLTATFDKARREGATITDEQRANYFAAFHAFDGHPIDAIELLTDTKRATFVDADDDKGISDAAHAKLHEVVEQLASMIPLLPAAERDGAAARIATLRAKLAGAGAAPKKDEETVVGAMEMDTDGDGFPTDAEIDRLHAELSGHVRKPLSREQLVRALREAQASGSAVIKLGS